MAHIRSGQLGNGHTDYFHWPAHIQDQLNGPSRGETPGVGKGETPGVGKGLGNGLDKGDTPGVGNSIFLIRSLVVPFVE